MLLLSTFATAAHPSADPAVSVDPQLEHYCLECHREQRLPDNLIYRRYLIKYSSRARIEKALMAYLKHPSEKRSIMPAEFFLRFPMREPIKLEDSVLRENIQRYIDYFDVRKRLRLEE